MRITKTQNRGMQKGKLPFLVKIVYMNALVEVAKIIRMHGLYPIPRHDIAKRSPQMDMAHRYLMKRERGDVAESFDKLRSTMQNKDNRAFSAAVKRSVLGARHLSGNVYDPTTLTFFICSYIEWLNETHLAITNVEPIFTIGNWYGASVDSRNQLDNLVMRKKPKDEESESMVTNMNDLCITDGVGPRSLSTHAINVYEVQNGHLKRSEEFEKKRQCIKAATPQIMTINTNKEPVTQPPKRRKKSTKTKSTKQQETPQAQATTPQPSSAITTTSPTDEQTGDTTTVVTKLPMTTPPQATQESSTNAPATPNDEDVQCLDFLNKLSPLMKLCKEKKDIGVTTQFDMALKGIMNYVKNRTGQNYTTMEEATTKLATTTRNEETDKPTSLNAQEDLNHQVTLKDLTKDEALERLREFKEEHDPNDTMTLNVQATINQVMNSYGLQNSADLDPTGERYRDEFIIMRYTKAAALWDCYQNIGKQASIIMSSLRKTLAEIKERGWVISVEENKSEPVGNLVVITKRSAYEHIRDSKFMRPTTEQGKTNDTRQLETTSTESGETSDASRGDPKGEKTKQDENETTTETATDAIGKEGRKAGKKKSGTKGSTNTPTKKQKISTTASPGSMPKSPSRISQRIGDKKNKDEEKKKTGNTKTTGGMGTI